MRLSASAVVALEERLFRGWPPARIVELHGWRCALDRGVTHRANSVWPLAWDAAVELDAAIEEAERLYREAGLRPCFRIVAAARPAGLDRALDARGYALEGASHCLVAALPPAELPGSRAAGAEIALLDRPSEAWLACYEDNLAGEAARLAVRGIFARLAPPHVFGAAVAEGRIASVALAVATERWVQVSAVRTLPDFRRRGLAEAVMAAIAGWARSRAVRNLALFVEASNAPALALYRKAGFERAYDYRYRALP